MKQWAEISRMEERSQSKLPSAKKGVHVQLGSTMPAVLAPSTLLRCISLQPSSRHIPPPGISYWQRLLDGSSILIAEATLSPFKSGSRKPATERNERFDGVEGLVCIF